MAVIVHVFDAGKTAVLTEKSAVWSVRPVESGAGIDCLGPLVLACHADARPGPRVSLAGLRAELATREGRAAVGLGARSAAAGQDGEIVGFALVIEASGGRGQRFSLAWLLVHPAVRRQGVATALLATACVYVTSRGGTEIHVESLSTWPDAVAFWDTVATTASHTAPHEPHAPAPGAGAAPHGVLRRGW
jgi:GNAT superfamily N-acetyltransferase